MRPDEVEDAARAVGALVAGSPGIYRWNGYTADEDLIPLRQENENHIHFVRASDGQARMEIFDFRPIRMSDIKFHEPVVLSTQRKASASIELDARNIPTGLKFDFYREFGEGESELDGVTAGFSISSKTTIGTGQNAPAKVEQEFMLTISSEWSKQRGKTKDSKTGGLFPFTALPHTQVRAWLEWNEQDLRMLVSCNALIDFGVRIGKRSPTKGRHRWRWSGDAIWHSLSDLVAVAEGKGDINWDLARHWRERPPKASLIAPIKAMPRVPTDYYADFKGNNAFKVSADLLADLREEMEGK